MKKKTCANILQEKKMEKLKSLKHGKAVGQRIARKRNKHLKSEKLLPATFRMTLRTNGKNECEKMKDSLKGHISVFFFRSLKFITLTRAEHAPKSNSIILPNCFSNSISAAISSICCSHGPNCERQRIIFLRHSGGQRNEGKKNEKILNPKQRHNKFNREKMLKFTKDFSI